MDIETKTTGNNFKESFFKYNPKILYKEINRLYRLSILIIIFRVFLYVVIGVIIDVLLIFVHFKGISSKNYLFNLIFVLCFFILGIIDGLMATFKFRLEAQKILCMVEIKKNTDIMLEKLEEENSSENGEEDKKSGKFTLGNDDEFIM